MTTKGGRFVTEGPSACRQRSKHRWKHSISGRYCEVSRAQAVLLVAAFLLDKAAYLQGSKVVYGSRGGKSCKMEPLDDSSNNAVAFPGGEEEEESPGEEDTPPTMATTGQRVAGHLLAVLLLASVAAAIVEAVRARMSQCKSPPKTGEAGGTASDTHHSSSVHGAGVRTPRRVPLQEKSHSQDNQLPRARSSSAGVSSHQEGTAAAVAVAMAASRAQKALRARLLGGKPLALGVRTGGTPPLIRRSSFPVMTRAGSICGRDANSGSPGMGTRKPSVNDSADDEMGDFQKRRIRIIRRF